MSTVDVIVIVNYTDVFCNLDSILKIVFALSTRYIPHRRSRDCHSVDRNSDWSIKHSRENNSFLYKDWNTGQIGEHLVHDDEKQYTVSTTYRDVN